MMSRKQARPRWERFHGRVRLLRRWTAALAIGAMLPMGTAMAAETNETNEDSTDYLKLEDYIITAERIPTNRWDTPANVAVITAEEIEANHYQDLAEALSHVNGIVSTSGRGSKVFLNGSAYVAVLIDGQRLPSGEMNAGDERAIDLSYVPSMKMIERIEIVKGGGSALYGSDAVGGVVNIITKKGARNESTIDFNMGSWKRRNFEFTNQGTDGRLSWFITGGLHRSDPYSYADKGAIDHINESRQRDYDDKTASIRLDHRFNERNSLTALLTHRSGDADIGSKSVPTSRRYINGRGAYQKGHDIYNNIAITYNFKEGTPTPGYLRYFNTDITARQKFLYDYSADIGDTTVYSEPYVRMQGIAYQNGWQIGNGHTLIAGLEGYRKELSMEMGFNNLWGSGEKTPAYGGKYSMTNTSAYVQDTICIGDKWSAVAGVRVDHNSEYGNHWSPKIAVNYRADEKTKFYTSWGRVLKAPSLTNLYVTYNAIHANRHLDAMTGHTETIGMEHNFDDNTSIAVNYFYTKLNNVVTAHSLNNSSGWLYYGNAGEEKQHGFEVSFHQNLNDDWSYQLGYSHTYATPYANLHYAQPNGYRLGVQYSHGPWKVNLLGIMGSGFDNDLRSDPGFYAPRNFAVFDLNASYDINEQVTVYVKANNFTNQDYADGGYIYHSSGRFFLAGLDCRF